MATTTTTTTTATVGGGTTVDNLNVLDTSKTNDTGGLEVINFSEIASLLTTAKLPTQSQTIYDAFTSGSLTLTFQKDATFYTIFKNTTSGLYEIDSTSSNLGTYAAAGLSVYSNSNLTTFLNTIVSNGYLSGASLLTTADLDGGSAKDVIQGISSNANIHNVIQGGTGADVLSGGLSSDYFVYKAIADSAAAGQTNPGGNPAQTWDQITNFSHAQGDKIDLTALANTFGSFSWGGAAGPVAGVNSVWY